MGDIEVFADVWCPFTHVGLRAVTRRRRELARGDVALRVRAWPLELVNGSPVDPALTAVHVAELRAQVAPGLFAGFDPDRFPTSTLPALALVARAYREGVACGEAISLSVRDALFEEGLDVSSDDVLGRIAARFALTAPTEEDHASVLHDWAEGRARGVRGSPHFFCADRDAFCPSLVIIKDDSGEVHVERNTRALEDFLAACFEG